MRVMSFTLLSVPLLVVALLFTVEYFYDKKKVELELEDEYDILNMNLHT
jgi:hypothetical protein